MPPSEPERESQADEVLMAAYCRGEQAAFDALFNRYATPLYRVVRRQVRSEEDARELVQQTFLHLHRARQDFRPGAKLRPWLFTIALNLRREYFRRKGRRPEAPLALDGRSDPREAPYDPQEKERAFQLHQALLALPEDQREVIALHWFDELPFPEVARVVGASVSAVKVRAHRGYRRLRTLLDAAALAHSEQSVGGRQEASAAPRAPTANHTDSPGIRPGGPAFPVKGSP